MARNLVFLLGAFGSHGSITVAFFGRRRATKATVVCSMVLIATVVVLGFASDAGAQISEPSAGGVGAMSGGVVTLPDSGGPVGAPRPSAAPADPNQPGASAPALVNSGFVRGKGSYLSVWKILLVYFFFLLWVYHATWVSRDSQELKNVSYLRWNPIIFGVFFGAFALQWLIPYYWVGFALVVVAYLAPLITYIVIRNKGVTNDKRVMTPEHIRFWFSETLAPLGVKISTERKAAHEKGPPVTLEARDADEVEMQARPIRARQLEGFQEARQLVANALTVRGSAIMLDYTQQAVGVRFMIDGVWHNHEGLDRESGDTLLASLKVLCGLNPQERQKRQKGAFLAKHEGLNYECSLASQGVQTGERVVIQMVDPLIHLETLEDLGLAEKMREEVAATFSERRGFILVSAPATHGLRTSTHVMLSKTDRFTREFLACEEESHRYVEVENCPVHTFSAAKGETPMNMLPRLFRMAPDVMVCRDLVNGESVDLLCDEINVDDGRLIVSTVRAKDAVDAIMRVLALGADRRLFAESLHTVICQRLVRKLCEECKEAYAPPPQVLKQLGIPEGKIPAFYRPPQQPEEPCEACRDLGYVGRTGLFEILKVSDGLRKAIAKGATAEQLREVARRSRHRNMQAEGVLMVAKGITSLAEVMRVLKE